MENFTSLALDGKDWDRDTLLGAFDNILAAYGLLNTLSDAKRNSSRISASTVFIMPQHNGSLSVDYVVP